MKLQVTCYSSLFLKKECPGFSERYLWILRCNFMQNTNGFPHSDLLQIVVLPLKFEETQLQRKVAADADVFCP